MNKNSEYEKMPKSLKGLPLSEKAMQDLHKLKWVVTEKIHGANFSFVYEDHRLLFAKRKAYLQWTDDFFGFQAVVAEMEERIIRLFEQLQQDIPAQRYIVYGELFGGKYPHPDVAQDPQVQAIQTGVYYCPAVRFCAFDIAVETTEGAKRYIDYDTAMTCFQQFDIFYAKPLFTGKWNEALNFDTRIPSAVPAQLQLPELTATLIEGVVIKPLHHSGLTSLDVRPIIKLKNPEFDEEEKFHEAEKWSFIPEVSSRAAQLSFLVEEMARYITKNRLDSVLSKTGRLDAGIPQRMEEVRKEFLDDVFTDFNEDNGHILADLEAADCRWVKERVGSRITVWMADHAGTPE